MRQLKASSDDERKIKPICPGDVLMIKNLVEKILEMLRVKNNFAVNCLLYKTKFNFL
jgi:hypothetical protein